MTRTGEYNELFVNQDTPEFVCKILVDWPWDRLGDLPLTPVPTNLKDIAPRLKKLEYFAAGLDINENLCRFCKRKAYTVFSEEFLGPLVDSNPNLNRVKLNEVFRDPRALDICSADVLAWATISDLS